MRLQASGKKDETSQKSQSNNKRKVESPCILKDSKKKKKGSKQGKTNKQAENDNIIGTKQDSEKNLSEKSKVK